MLSKFRPQTTTSKQQKETEREGMANIVKESKDGNRTVVVSTAIETIYKVFPEIDMVAKESLTRVIESCAQLDETDGLTQVRLFIIIIMIFIIIYLTFTVDYFVLVIKFNNNK